MCEHLKQRPYILISKCEDCGLPIHHRIETAAGNVEKFAYYIQKVYQGLIPADYISMNVEINKEQRKQLEEIIPCLHIERERITCCGGVDGERCNQCGRVFQNPALWILEHALGAQSEEGIK